MSPIKLDITVRTINAKTSILDIQGEVTGSAQSILMDAYTQATAAGAEVVPELRRAGVHEQLRHRTASDDAHSHPAPEAAAAGLRVECAEHYRQIFDLTQLDKAIGIFRIGSRRVAAAA